MISFHFFLIEVLAIMVWDALDDYFKITSNKYIIYLEENLRALLMYGTAALIALIFGVSWKMILAVLVLVPSVRWIVHDTLLNYFRGKNLDYLGTRSLLDRFLTHIMPVVAPIVVKLYALNLSCIISLSILTL
jgi:hypothetical protein